MPAARVPHAVAQFTFLSLCLRLLPGLALCELGICVCFARSLPGLALCGLGICVCFARSLPGARLDLLDLFALREGLL